MQIAVVAYCLVEVCGVHLRAPSQKVGELLCAWCLNCEATKLMITCFHERAPRVPLSPHLYGELAKTEAGCRLLRQSNHVPHFVHTVEDPSSVPIERRAALWALVRPWNPRYRLHPWFKVGWLC